MKYNQYLLIKLAEEASEIAQSAIKCSLFGYDSKDPREDKGDSNLVKLQKEMCDMSAVLDELDENNGELNVANFNVNNYIQDKRKKLQYYYDIACINMV